MEFAFLDLRRARDTYFLILLNAQFIQGYSTLSVHTQLHLQHTIKCKETKECSLQLLSSQTMVQVPLVLHEEISNIYIF